MQASKVKNKITRVIASLLCLSLMAVCGATQAENEKHFIVGGDIVFADDAYPYIAAVYIDSQSNNEFTPLCGGVLVASRWVLTAAHCLYNQDFKRPINSAKIGVLLGQNNLSKRDGYFVGIKNIIIHPEFESKSNLRDVALLELDNDYPATPVLLPSSTFQFPEFGEFGTVLGWGALVEDGPRTTRLREVDLQISSSASCLPSYPNFFDSRYSFCAGGARSGGQDACQGDSGGPLLVERNGELVLAGVVSYGHGCGRESVPGVYTRVAAFTDWINSYADISVRTIQLNSGVDEFPEVQLLGVNSSVTGSVEQGQVLYFSFADAKQINLTSNTGDADLFIIEGDNFRTVTKDSVLCVSELGPPLDICVIDENANNRIAVVYGFLDSSFTLSAQNIRSNAGLVQPFSSSSNVSSTNTSKPILGIGKVHAFYLLALLMVLCLRCCNNVPDSA